MDKKLANNFFKETSSAFAFLVNEHSFATPQLEVNDKIHFAHVTFIGKNIAITCSLDEREGDIDCRIARVIDGKKATYRDAISGIDERGTRVHESLYILLVRKGVRERLLTQITALGPHDRIKVTLADYAQMLRKHGQEILNDSPAALT